jgi:hypothetical protein
MLGEILVPTPFVLRRISTGVRALKRPTDGRRSYLACELAKALDVHESTISRWIGRGYLKAEKTAGGFMVIPLNEALRFSREGPRPRARNSKFLTSELPP